MKKVLMILLTLAMVFSMAGVVSADDTTDITGNSGNTEVTYNTEQGYIVTIPTKVAFAEGSLESANFVKATNVLLPDGALLEVNVSSPNDFNLVYGSGLTVSKIPYIVTKYDGNIAVNNDPVLQVASGVTESSADLTFSTTEENVKQATLSGEHKDTLEFTVTVKGGSTSGDTQEPSVIYIGNKEQLLAFAADVNDGNTYERKTVKLTADIDLQNEEWTPIGPNADAVNKFKGTFDGQGHTISNLNVDTAAGYTAAGFFGALNGVAKNFVIDGATIKHVSTGDPSDNGIAVVAGSLYNKGTIDGVIVKNAVVEGNRYTGGISGYTYGTVKNCEVIDSEITAVPNTLDSGGYDNGDKVGGIAGYWSSESAYSMIGNIVENVVLKAYRDVGGIVGTANGVTADNLKDNSVKDVTIIVDQKTNSYGTKDKNPGEIVGRVTSGALVEGANDAENVVIYENYVKPDVGSAINLAGLTGSILVELGEGNYGDVTFPSNAKITFIGAGKDKTTIDFGNNHEGATGCTLVFDGIKLKRSTNKNYNGIQSLTSATYNDCAFEGQHFLYGTKAVFNKCVFTTTDAENYNVWTYGVAEVTFNTCQFTCAGKSVLIYNEGHGGQIANFNGCTFTAAPVDGKAAIEVDSSLLQGGQTYTVNIDSTTTANGFAAGSVSGETLWNVKKDTDTSKTTVKVGGNTVYPTTTP